MSLAIVNGPMLLIFIALYAVAFIAHFQKDNNHE